MKKLIIASFALLLLLNSCDDGFGLFDGGKRIVGKGSVEKQDRDAKDFKGIDLMATGDVFVKQGSVYKVVVEGQKNITDLIETVVENNILLIKMKEGSWNLSYEKLNIYIETPSVSSLEISGSGDITVESAFQTDDMTVSISGSGNIKLPNGLTAKTLKSEIGGSGDVQIGSSTVTDLAASVFGSGNFTIKGTGDKAKLSVTGSGDIEANEFVAKSVEAQTTGSGNITCHATESIDAQITGSGDIRYSGNPPAVKASETGSGNVTKK